MAKLVEWSREIFLKMRNLNHTWKEGKGPTMQRLMAGRSIAAEGPTNAKSWKLAGLCL